MSHHTTRFVYIVSVVGAVLFISLVPIAGRGQAPAAPAGPAVPPLADLVVPAGFRVSVFASDLVGARLMTVSPEGVLLVARRRTHEVVALPDTDGDGRAGPHVILTGMTNAHSLAFHGGYLYIATTPAVMRVRWADGGPVGEPERFVELPSSTPAVHTSRTIGFGKDGRLYVSIGSSCDVCVEADARRTTIQVYNPDGSSAGAYATGLRNANGFDWDPATGRGRATTARTIAAPTSRPTRSTSSKPANTTASRFSSARTWRTLRPPWAMPGPT